MARIVYVGYMMADIGYNLANIDLKYFLFTGEYIFQQCINIKKLRFHCKYFQSKIFKPYLYFIETTSDELLTNLTQDNQYWFTIRVLNKYLQKITFEKLKK